MVPQLDRAQAEGLDGALVAAALDVLADPERVVEQVEHAADDVLDQRLCAESDGDADDPRTGDERPDLDAKGRQRHQQRHHHENDEQEVAQDRQQRSQPGPAARLLAVGLTRFLHLGDLPIDQCLQRMPSEVGDEHDDDGVQRAPQQARGERVPHGQRAEVYFPRPGQQQRGADDEQGAQAAGQRCGGDSRRRSPLTHRARRPQEMIDRAPRRLDRRRQPDDDHGQPESRHGVGHPQQPQQHEIARQQPCADAALGAGRRRGLGTVRGR